jgi:hypothetical protein
MERLIWLRVLDEWLSGRGKRVLSDVLKGSASAHSRRHDPAIVHQLAIDSEAR